MKKYLFIFWIILGCKSTPSIEVIKYPRVGYNAGTKKWAILTRNTGLITYYFGNSLDIKPDTTDESEMGFEFQFNDSMTALNCFKDWRNRFVTKLAAFKLAQDSEWAAYKNEHTYK